DPLLSEDFRILRQDLQQEAGEPEHKHRGVEGRAPGTPLRRDPHPSTPLKATPPARAPVPVLTGARRPPRIARTSGHGIHSSQGALDQKMTDHTEKRKPRLQQLKSAWPDLWALIRARRGTLSVRLPLLLVNRA